jgi:hypothetical protein
MDGTSAIENQTSNSTIITPVIVTQKNLILMRLPCSFFLP